MPRPLAITLGDVTGIGPEIVLKALAALADADRPPCVIVGDAGWLERANRGIHLPLRSWSGDLNPGRCFHVDPRSEPLPAALATGAPEAARAAVDWLRAAARGCLAGEFAGMVTAPVNKAAIIRAGVPFTGQTELLAGLAETRRAGMMLLGQDDRGRWLRVMLATTHLPLARVAAALTAERVERAIELAAEACRRLRLPRARIGVAGLNPHAGEGGLMGKEEVRIIAPVCDRCRTRGLDVVGPVPADTLFHQAYRGEFDVVVAMYHDQGLAPLKMIAFDNGVNWTVGLPFVRTSPDHGTAYDLAGRNQANPASMIAALRLAVQLCPQD